jgi:hypothetical protein
MVAADICASEELKSRFIGKEGEKAKREIPWREGNG